MREQSNHDPGEIDIWAEHLVVLDIVGIQRGRSREQVHEALTDIDPARLDRAIERLEASGIVETNDGAIRQTAALARLDRLDMICI